MGGAGGVHLLFLLLLRQSWTRRHGWSCDSAGHSELGSGGTQSSTGILVTDSGAAPVWLTKQLAERTCTSPETNGHD